ncbi:hypothetical protein PTMSG1_02895 [Pyrenophora teres f. maculata]|nr:hypothetical protein PTMSG1_02895 [Pyrenophora teres f. maculata]
MPLAIVQAAAYISQRAPLCSVAKYLEEFTKSERKRLRLLAHDDGQPRRDWEAKSAIAVTWLISFVYIEQTQPGAADLLSLMSFFDRQGIPEALLQPRSERAEAQTKQTEADYSNDDESEGDKPQSSWGDDEFRDALKVMRNFCFISVDTAGTSFGMHSLVQLATRKWLEDNGKLERWKQQCISNLRDAFPTGEFENWAACQALFAHAKAAVGQRPDDELSLAEELEVQVMETRKKKLGADHPDTLTSMANLAFTWKAQGRSAEACEDRQKMI